MACNTILSYTPSCGKSPVVGVNQLFLIAYNDLKPVSGSTEVYSLGINDMVTEISLATGSTKFAKIGILPKAVAVKNTYAFDPTKGTAEIGEELTLPVANVTNDSRKLLKSLTAQPVVAIIKFSTNVYVALGLNGMLNVTAAESNVNGTDNGFTITFSGTGDDFAPIVDPTIVPALV
jgi:hypothetical protein